MFFHRNQGEADTQERKRVRTDNIKTACPLALLQCMDPVLQKSYPGQLTEHLSMLDQHSLILVWADGCYASISQYDTKTQTVSSYR